MPTVHETLLSAAQSLSSGNLPEAERGYAAVLQTDPRQAQAWHGLGLVAYERGEAARAIECLSRAVLLDGACAELHNHLGAVLQSQSRLADAVASYRRALELAPEYADAHCNLGSAYKDQQQYTEAIACYRRALELKPGLAEAHFNLGVVHQHHAHYDQAIACYEQAVALRDSYWQAHNNLGTVYKLVGRFDDAMRSYQRALAGQQDVAEAHRNRALLRLLLGDFTAGWPEYEWRWSVRGAARHNVSQPRWQGQPLPRGTVLIKSEQGLGDTIQFIRYARLVKERSGGRVLLECPKSLQGLLAGVADVDGFATEPWEQEAIDAYVPLLSLPAVFQTTLESVPRQVPYLAADPQHVARWRDRLASTPGFKVGICWQGNPGYSGDAARSIPLAEFAPLAACENVGLISLQKQHGCNQMDGAAQTFALADLGPSLDADAAFVDTAAVMQSLDLVVTSDTAIAHLAGALGVRVWVALQKVPDWRWLVERQDSPWYPTMRLFRQARAGDWQSVFEQMAGELGSLSAAGPLG